MRQRRRNSTHHLPPLKVRGGAYIKFYTESRNGIKAFLDEYAVKTLFHKGTVPLFTFCECLLHPQTLGDVRHDREGCGPSFPGNYSRLDLNPFLCSIFSQYPKRITARKHFSFQSSQMALQHRLPVILVNEFCKRF